MRGARVDSNQGDIVSALRRAGCTVQSLARLGDGCPDLLVGAHGRNYLLEVKGATGTRTPAQLTWHGNWNGVVCIVRSADEALEIVRLLDPR